MNEDFLIIVDSEVIGDSNDVLLIIMIASNSLDDNNRSFKRLQSILSQSK